MKIFSAYTSGAKSLSKYPLAIVLVYCVQLFSALLLAIPVLRIVENNFSAAMSPENLSNKFNFSIFGDIMKDTSQAIPNHNGQFIILIFLSIILYVFISGGIIQSIKDGKFTSKEFFGAGAIFFFRNLRICFYMLLVYSIIALIVFVPAVLLLQSFLNGKATIIASALLLILSTIPFLQISDYSKINMQMDNSQVVVNDIWKATKFVFSRFFSNYTLFLLLQAFPIAAMAIYAIVSSYIPGKTLLGVCFIVVLQNIYLFARNWFIFWQYESEMIYYTNALNFVRSIEKEKIAGWEKQAESAEKSMIAEAKKLKDSQRAEELDNLMNEINSQISKVKNNISNVEEKIQTRKNVLTEIENLTKAGKTTETTSENHEQFNQQNSIQNTEIQTNTNEEHFWEMLEEEKQIPVKEPEKKNINSEPEDLLELDL